MTIAFTKKLLVVAASAAMLALGAAPAGLAGEDDDGPTANGEQIGSSLSSGGSGNGSSSGAKSGAKSGVKGAQKTLEARTDTTRAQGAAQTGFGGMADTPGGSLLLTLLIGAGGVAAVAGARGLSTIDRSDR
jgi:hypothetical protein